MKRKTGIGLLALAFTAFLFWLMWDTVSVCLFPRLVLSGAVQRDAAQLWEEYAQSPVYMLSQLLDQGENYTAGIKLFQIHPVAGEVRYDLEAVVQDSPRRISVDGFLTLAERELDVSVYLDEMETAFSSTKLLKDGWYGFCFDSIGRDVRGNPVLSFLLGEDKLQELERYAASVKDWVNRELPQIPLVREEDIQDLGMGVLMLDLDIQPDILEIEGRRHRVFRLSSVISGEEIGAAVTSCREQLPDWAIDFAQWIQQEDEAAVKLEFVMGDGSLYGFSACVMAEDAEYMAEVILRGDSPAITVHGQGTDRSFSVTLGPEEESSEYTQRIWISRTDEGVKNEISCAFRWDAPTGNLWLSLTDGTQTGHAHVLLTRHCLRLEAANLDPLLEILTGRGYGMEGCVLNLMSGGQVSKPDYLDFPEWSMDDLFLLLEGFGGFLGLQTE